MKSRSARGHFFEPSGKASRVGVSSSASLHAPLTLALPLQADSLLSEDLTEQEEAEALEDESMYRVAGPLREWLKREEVRRFVALKFRHLLLTFREDGRGGGGLEGEDTGEPEYMQRIKELVECEYLRG